MDSASWLIDYYCVIVDVISPACGLAVAVSAAVLISIYKDLADTITVRISGLLGLSDALYQITWLITRELALRPSLQTPNGAARVFAFTTYFFPLLNTFLVSRVALDLELNFLGWFACSGNMRWAIRHYVQISAALAFALTSPLLFATSRFDGQFSYPQWSFGNRNRDVIYMIFGFYLWIAFQLANFVAVVCMVVMRLHTKLPSEENPLHSLSTGVMRSLEHRMRRKAKILLLFPLSPLLFYTPSLVFYWIQALRLTQTKATEVLWIASLVVAPLHSVFDMLVFAMLPPVQRVVRFYCVLHKDSLMVPLYSRMHRESIFAGHLADATLTTEEAWVEDISEPRYPIPNF